jgi:hypothetical protein
MRIWWTTFENTLSECTTWFIALSSHRMLLRDLHIGRRPCKVAAYRAAEINPVCKRVVWIQCSARPPVCERVTKSVYIASCRPFVYEQNLWCSFLRIRQGAAARWRWHVERISAQLIKGGNQYGVHFLCSYMHILAAVRALSFSLRWLQRAATRTLSQPLLESDSGRP